MQPFYRPHYGITRLARPSVRLSVCSVLLVTQVSKTKKKKIKTGVNVPEGTCQWVVNFQLKRSKVEVAGHQKPKKIAAYLGYMFTYEQQRRRSGTDCKLGLSHC